MKVHRMMVRSHEWKIHHCAWSMKIRCATPQGGWRAEWAIQGAGRLRKKSVIQALPEFFRGYAAAVQAAGKTHTAAGKRSVQLARDFT